MRDYTAIEGYLNASPYRKIILNWFAYNRSKALDNSNIIKPDLFRYLIYLYIQSKYEQLNSKYVINTTVNPKLTRKYINEFFENLNANDLRNLVEELMETCKNNNIILISDICFGFYNNDIVKEKIINKIYDFVSKNKIVEYIEKIMKVKNINKYDRLQKEKKEIGHNIFKKLFYMLLE